MTTFDERFADRVREVFEAYEEPVDEAALAQLRAVLGGAAPALDRPSVRSAARRRRDGLVVVAVVVLIGGVWAALSSRPPSPGPDRLGADAARPAPAGGPVADATAPPAAAATPEVAPPSPPSAPPASVPALPLRVPAEAASPRAPAASTSRPAPALVAEAAPSPPATPPLHRTGTLARLPVAPPTLAASDGAVTVRPDVPALRPVRLGRPAGPEAEGVRLVVATGTATSGGGVGFAAGAAREWPVMRGLAVSGGALLAYGRYATSPEGPSAATTFSTLERDPEAVIDVPFETVITTVAVEVPVDVAVDVVRAGRSRVRASVGLTSALYVGQAFEDEGQRYTAEYVAVPQTSGSVFVVSSEPYAATEAARPFGRLDLGRQLNLSVGLVGPGPRAPGLDVYARVPLGGLTSRDLPLTTVGVRLRVPFR